MQGQINELVDPIPFVSRVENISTSYGGSDIENDDKFRARIQIAPEHFSVAGPEGAYRFHLNHVGYKGIGNYGNA